MGPRAIHVYANPGDEYKTRRASAPQTPPVNTIPCPRTLHSTDSASSSTATSTTSSSVGLHSSSTSSSSGASASGYSTLPITYNRSTPETVRATANWRLAGGAAPASLSPNASCAVTGTTGWGTPCGGRVSRANVPGNLLPNVQASNEQGW